MTELVLPESARASTTDRLRALGYDVQHGIGSGAGGAVYKALQRSTGQAVAVKVLTLDDLELDVRARRIERFRREIAFCSSLYHPDIVRLLDSGELEEGHRFAVFEYIPGRTLAELLRDEGMLTVGRARNLLSQLLPPLAYAHAKGIAHRDLKPGNVMVTSDAARDRIKIVDFGISISTARDTGELYRLTQSHEWVGTPVYAAPEQLRGEPTGSKSDLYAWALMFVEALTGVPLVGGKSLAEIIAKQFRPEAHELPAPLAQHRLGALLLRALEKDPTRRLGDAELVQSLLERISTEGLEDARGYLKESAPVSAEFRSRRSPTDTVTDARLPEHTEQRRVTALCCRVRLVGTGALSRVEQIDALLEDSQALISEILRQFGATAASAMAGYSLWYFGLSQARDADARLAVRAALEIANRIQHLPSWFAETGLALAVQIGVHNGLVTVRLVDGRKLPVDGLTARVALDLAAYTPRVSPDGESSAVLVSEEFRELVARSAELELCDGGGQAFTTAIGRRQVFRLAGESRSTSVRPERAPFIGRAAEFEALTAIWRRTGSGEGALVLLSGEPGIGKSRLAAELMLGLEQQGCRALEIRCLPEWQNASLRPVQGLMRHLLGVTGPLSESAASLEQKVRELGLSPATAVPLFCVWLSVPIPPGFAPLTWSPQKQRQLLHELVVEAILVTLERGSALLVEDIHWADPSTLELLDLLANKVKSRSALVILTTRPDRAFSWSAPVEGLSLAGLDDSAVRALASALLPDTTWSSVNLAQFVARSDGVPLYVEELAIALRQKQNAAEGSSAASPAAKHGDFDGVPASLRDLLTSRLDEIGEGRRTAQFAAALGREFSLELLAALDTRDEFALASDLEELVAAQILVKRLRLGSPVYIFRHALIRDAAYDGMEASARERTHEIIATGLEGRFPELTASEPNILAHHYDRARQSGKAVHYWQLASQKSSFASAHMEAMAQIDRALELLGESLVASDGGVTESQLLLTRGAIIVGKRGYTDLDAKGCFERIASLVKPEGPSMPLAFAARWGLWYFNNTRANLRESCAIADELAALARDTGDPVMALTSSAAICESRFCTGQLAAAVEAARSCAAEYVFEEHRQLILRFGDDPRVGSGSFEALAEMVRGNYDLARTRVDEVLELTHRLGFPAVTAGMHGQAAWVFLNWGGCGASVPDLDLARYHAAEAMRIAGEYGFPFWDLYGRMNDAAIRVAGGDSSAVGELTTYSDMWCGTGAMLGRDWHLTFIAQGLQRAGAYREALERFDEALEFCQKTSSFYFEPEVRRQRAVLFADAKNPARDVELARAECARATSDARRLGARWWQLASLMTEARLEPAPGPGVLDEIESVLTELAPIPKPTDPPLVVEARHALT